MLQQKYYLSPFLRFIGVSLVILTLSRMGLAFWLNERIEGEEAWLQILLQGLRVDFSSLCWLLILPAFIHCLIPNQATWQKYWLFALRCWFVASLWLLVYMELATPTFISEYDLRPNRLFVEYLIYPKEVISMLWQGYKLPLFIGLVGTVVTLVWGWYSTGRWLTGLRLPRWYWRPVMALCVVAIGVMGARSTLGHRPLNPAMIAFSTDPLVNDLCLNSSYSLMFAIKNMSSEKSARQFYGNMDADEVISRVKESSYIPGEYLAGDMPTLNQNQPIYQGQPKNLVILLQESLGARFVGHLGGLPLTPNLDKLMQEGWSFNRMYATGTRSVRGIEAVTTGFWPTPSRAVVKLSKSQTGFFTIADLLQQQGYHTQFIYGGEAHFDNMKSFFLGNGFNQIIEQKDYKNPVFVGSWGASDEDLYAMAHTQFEQLNQTGKPFFSLVFTSSNHSPYEYPAGRIEPYDEEINTRNNTVKYSDWAIGEFFKQAKQSSYWDNTIFIVIADHDHDNSPKTGALVPVDRFHIPALILGKGITARQDQRLVSNIDMPPTLLSLIGAKNASPMLGHDMTKTVLPSQERALMQFDKNFGYLTNNKLIVFAPEKAPQAFNYDAASNQQLATTMTTDEQLNAQAHALWGSLAYQKGLYQAVKLAP